MTLLATPPFVLQIKFSTHLDYNENLSHAIRISFPVFLAVSKLLQNSCSRFEKIVRGRQVLKDPPKAPSTHFTETHRFSLKKFTSEGSFGYTGLLQVML